MDPSHGTENLSGEWVSAHDAIGMLLPVLGKRMGLAAAKTLANRAHSGLLKTRARLFTWEEPKGGPYDGSKKIRREAESAILPKEFWWAEGNPALTQNWVTGDFATWIDNKFYWQAFGTEFSRNDIAAMLPKVVANGQAGAKLDPHSDLHETKENGSSIPSDEAIEAKMQELIGMGMRRDVAAKVIRQISGFGAVGNEHARRSVAGKLPLGRPKMNAHK